MDNVKAFALFNYTEKATGWRMRLTIIKAKLKIILKFPSLLFGGKFEITDYKPTPFEYGIIRVKAYR